MQIIPTGILIHRAAICKCSHLIQGVFPNDQIIYFKGLVARNGRKFIQKFIYAYTNSHEVHKGLDSDARAAEYGRTILDFGVNTD